jgi:hypothetical protein
MDEGKLEGNEKAAASRRRALLKVEQLQLVLKRNRSVQQQLKSKWGCS